MSGNPSELLTASQVARMFGVDGSTVRKWVRLHQLAAIRTPGGHLRFRREDVDELLRGSGESREQEPERPTRPAPAEAATAPGPVTAPLKKRDRTARPVAMAIVVKDGLALMTHRRYKEPAFQWNFVSGEVEPGETPEQAAIREVREEVGLEVTIEHRLGDRIQPVSKRHMHYFICRVTGGDVDLVDHEENIAVAWCTLEEVYQHFEELAQIPGGLYRPLFEFLDQALTKAPV